MTASVTTKALVVFAVVFLSLGFIAPARADEENTFYSVVRVDTDTKRGRKLNGNVPDQEINRLARAFTRELQNNCAIDPTDIDSSEVSQSFCIVDKNTFEVAVRSGDVVDAIVACIADNEIKFRGVFADTGSDVTGLSVCIPTTTTTTTTTTSPTTTSPTASTTGWKIATGFSSCNDACDNNCYAPGMNAVNTDEKFLFVVETVLGFGNCGDLSQSSGLDFSPGAFDPDFCIYSADSSSTCSAQAPTRFCCCSETGDGSDCAVSPP